MSQATIRFKRCLQDSQDLGTEEHMVARVVFDLAVDGHVLEDLTVNIKQPVGDDYATAPIEVVKPEGYSGPLDLKLSVERWSRTTGDSSAPEGGRSGLPPAGAGGCGCATI